MNTIAGMLRMQARRAKDDDTKEALRRAVSRILGISQIHDILASQSGDKIDMDILLDKITKLSVDSLALIPVNVVRERSRRSLIVDSEKAVPLAIAANELIHNAIDHGFKDMEREHWWWAPKFEAVIFMSISEMMDILWLMISVPKPLTWDSRL